MHSGIATIAANLLHPPSFLYNTVLIFLMAKQRKSSYSKGFAQTLSLKKLSILIMFCRVLLRSQCARTAAFSSKTKYHRALRICPTNNYRICQTMKTAQTGQYFSTSIQMSRGNQDSPTIPAWQKELNPTQIEAVTKPIYNKVIGQAA